MLDDGADAVVVTEGFHALHQALYSYRVEGEPLELVNLRVRAVGAVPKAKLRMPDYAAGTVAVVRRRPVHLPTEDEACDMPVHRRADLGPGARIKGPALVEEASSTTFLVPRSRGVVDAFHNLVIEVEP